MQYIVVLIQFWLEHQSFVVLVQSLIIILNIEFENVNSKSTDYHKNSYR